MGRKWYLFVIVALTPAVWSFTSTAAAIKRARVSVTVPKNPSVARDLTITFRPPAPLPKGGYYYAVLILKRYPHHPPREPLECSGSSNISDTEFGHPHPGRPVHLTLMREKPPENNWCSRATYEGAIYSVPYAQPCRPDEGCYEEEHPSFPRKGTVEGVIRPQGKGSYPLELPVPKSVPNFSDTHIIARFQVRFSAAKPSGVPVAVPSHPSVAGNLTIGFDPRKQLPSGGYYYAAVVLTKFYRNAALREKCAGASNMEITEYGYPSPGEPVNLTLDPERQLDWCSGATYKGAIYAVPHAPPCPGYEPCDGHSTPSECYAGEPLCLEGKRAYGEVAQPFPGALPPPQDSSTRVIAYFTVHF